MSVDAIDAKIVSLLQGDSSLAYKDIASRLRMNESTVRKRIISLREKQVIKKFSVEVDPTKLGFEARSLIGLDVEPSKILEVGRRLKQVPEIRSVSTTLGEHEFLVEVWAEDQESLLKIIHNKLSTIEGVSKVSPSILVEKLK